MTVRMFRIIKAAVAIAAALLCFGLVRDWVQPGAGLHAAAVALGFWGRAAAPRIAPALQLASLGGYENGGSTVLWAWLVRLIGWDVRGLGMLSAAAGLAGAWLVYLTGKVVFAHYVEKMKKAKGVEGELWYVLIPTYSSMIAAYAYLGAVLDGGFSPLTTWAIAPLLGVYCAAVAWSRGMRRWWRRPGLWIVAAGLVGYGVAEGAMARRCLAGLVLPAAGWFVLLGALPLAVMVNLTYRRQFVIHRAHRRTILAVWAAVVVAFAGARLTSERGRETERVVAAIAANVGESGKIVLVSDGGLDDLFAFMLPKGVRLISLAREWEPEYGRELSDWVKGSLGSLGSLGSEGSIGSEVEDLAFAAELGPRALIDEWVKIDKAGFEAKVATVADYFPTRAKWDEARALVGGGEVEHLRRLMGVAGNALGCRALEEGRKDEAWNIFWDIIRDVDKENYAAVLNLIGMSERGFDPGKRAVEFVQRRRTEIESRLKKPVQRFLAARSGGRLYVDPEALKRYEAAQRAEAEKRELSPKAQEFVKTVAAAPKDPKSGKAAREAIYKAVKEGEVRLDRIGGHLIAIDLALGDGEAAEKDALAVLRANRHDPTANTAMGSLAVARGDYGRAERYLRRAVATGKASIGAKNDLAYALTKRGRFDEAEPFAREAVRAYGENWNFRETLAAILIAEGKTEEGERELGKAEELAEKAGVPKGKVASFAIDRARLHKVKGNAAAFNVAVRLLKGRKDLTDEQREEVKAMGER